MQKHVNLVDLVKSFQTNIVTSIYKLFAKLRFDTAENEPEYEYGISLIFVSLVFGPVPDWLPRHPRVPERLPRSARDSTRTSPNRSTDYRLCTLVEKFDIEPFSDFAAK